jgi:beta-lactam-binding protein with PASTA domain
MPDVEWLKCDVDQNNYTPGYCGIRSIPSFIVVANGKVDVPDVRGLSLKDATAKLNSPQYMVPVVTAGDKSCKSDAALTVGAQSVLGEAPLGTSVTIYYCSG